MIDLLFRAYSLMAAKIGAGATSTDALTTAFLALGTLEQQAVFLFEEATRQQTVHNADSSNVDTQINKVGAAVGTNAGETVAACQASGIVLDNSAVTGLLWNGCQPFGFDVETRLTPGGAQSGLLADLTAIPTLPGQLVFLVAQLEQLESAAIEADDTFQGRVNIAVNYDSKRVQATFVAPAGGSSIASSVNAYV